MAKTYKTFEHIRETIDGDTGEVKLFQRQMTKKVDKQRFILVYLEHISGLISIKSPIEFKVILSLWSMAEYDTNQVILVKDIKQEIADSIGYKFKTVENAISRLAKKGVLIKKGSSIYVLNPKYFFKGSEIARGEVMKLVLAYELEDEKT